MECYLATLVPQLHRNHFVERNECFLFSFLVVLSAFLALFLCALLLYVSQRPRTTVSTWTTQGFVA